MIGSGSFCTVEGVKVSVSFFPPDEAVRAVAGAHGGGEKEIARERRGNNENVVMYKIFRGSLPRRVQCRYRG